MLWAIRMGLGGAILGVALTHIAIGHESWWGAFAGFIPAFAWALHMKDSAEGKR